MTQSRILAGLVALTVAAAGPLTAETWKGVSVVDTMCLSKVKADPDKHTKACALQCSKGGYGLLTSEGTYLKFDEAGNEKTLAALKTTKKTESLRATVEGTKKGETIEVVSITLD